MTTYRAIARRTGGWWAIEVPDVPGVFTQARRLDQVDAMVRDVIAAMLDVATDSFDISVDPVLEGDVAKAVAQARRRREEARKADERAQAAARDALVTLERQGLSVRDVGKLLGVSPQRVSQIRPRRAMAKQTAIKATAKKTTAARQAAKKSAANASSARRISA
jgi:predicted RNase H-like HicB family nuclease